MPRSNTDPPLHLQMTVPVGAKQLGLAEAAAPGQCQGQAAPLLNSLSSPAWEPQASFLLLLLGMGGFSLP